MIKRWQKYTLLFAGGLLPLFTMAEPPPAPVEVAAVGLFKNKAVLVINGKRRILKSGATSPEGVQLIRSNSESATIKIADQETVLRLDGKIVGSSGRGTPVKTLQLYPEPGGHYLADGTINGNRVRFIVDTGASAVVINKTAAKRIGLLYRVDGRQTLVETASGVVTGYAVVFDRVSIRSMMLKRVAGMVVDGDFPRTALLGQSFLNRINMRREGQLLELSER